MALLRESTDVKKKKKASFWPRVQNQCGVTVPLSGGGGDSGKALPLVPQPNPIFFHVIPLPLLNTAALSELSPHKLPLECQRQSNNSDGAVA